MFWTMLWILFTAATLQADYFSDYDFFNRPQAAPTVPSSQGIFPKIWSETLQGNLKDPEWKHRCAKFRYLTINRLLREKKVIWAIGRKHFNEISQSYVNECVVYYTTQAEYDAAPSTTVEKALDRREFSSPWVGKESLNFMLERTVIAVVSYKGRQEEATFHIPKNSYDFGDSRKKSGLGEFHPGVLFALSEDEKVTSALNPTNHYTIVPFQIETGPNGWTNILVQGSYAESVSKPDGSDRTASLGKMRLRITPGASVSLEYEKGAYLNNWFGSTYWKADRGAKGFTQVHLQPAATKMPEDPIREAFEENNQGQLSARLKEGFKKVGKPEFLPFDFGGWKGQSMPGRLGGIPILDVSPSTVFKYFVSQSLRKVCNETEEIHTEWANFTLLRDLRYVALGNGQIAEGEPHYSVVNLNGASIENALAIYREDLRFKKLQEEILREDEAALLREKVVVLSYRKDLKTEKEQGRYLIFVYLGGTEAFQHTQFLGTRLVQINEDGSSYVKAANVDSF